MDIQYMVIYCILLLLILLFWYNSVEHYWDIGPYKLYNNIYRCHSMDCVKDEGVKCYDWCDRWAELGGSEKCKLNCLDAGDKMSDNLKYNYAIWNRLLGKFDEFSLLDE